MTIFKPVLGALAIALMVSCSDDDNGKGDGLGGESGMAGNESSQSGGSDLEAGRGGVGEEGGDGAAGEGDLGGGGSNDGGSTERGGGAGDAGSDETGGSPPSNGGETGESGTGPAGGVGQAGSETTGGTGDGGATGGTGGGAAAGSGGTGGGSGGDGPDCTQFFEASSSLDAIENAINSAAAGEVICLARGASWSGGIMISNTGASVDNRITVCAGSADTSTCTDSGGANPRITGPGSAFTLSERAGGFVFKNIDAPCTSGCDDASGFDLQGTSHVRIEGGVVSGWSAAAMCNSWTTSAPCDDIEFGVPDNLMEIHSCGMGFYGWLSNSFVRINAHDNGAGSVLDHHWYLSSGPQEAPSSNVVFEYGRYTRSSVGDGGLSMGTFINISGQNEDLVIRNNVFEDTDCGTYVVDVGSGDEDPVEYCDGLEISGNLFRTDCALVFNLAMTQHARVFNNLIVADGDGRSDDLRILSVNNESGEAQSSDVWFFNNTVYCAENCGSSSQFYFEGSDHRFFNNLIAFLPSGPPLVSDSNCSHFGGANGPDFHHNFLYAPDSSPRLPDCSAGTDNSTTFNLDPGFAAPENDDFHISASSPAAGFGASTDAPATDYDGTARPSPPSAGAHDVP